MQQLAPASATSGALVLAAFAAVAYLIGGIPWSLLIGRWVGGVDLREMGSGNLGSTNVARFLGGWWAVTVFALDFVKGALPVAAAAWLVAVGWRDGAMVTAGLAALVGHVYSPYIRFRGGKGIATTAGVAAALIPWVLLVGAVTFFAVALTTRRVSAGSLAICVVCVPAVLLLYPGHLLLTLFCVGVAIIIAFSHRSNIRRLIRGEEPKVSWGIFKDSPGA